MYLFLGFAFLIVLNGYVMEVSFCNSFTLLTSQPRITSLLSEINILKKSRERVTIDYLFLPLVGAAGACPGFGRFAPYFERRCLRPFTPAVSRAPRTMW